MTDEQTPRLTALMTEAGPSYVDMATVIVVTAPFESKGHEPSRSVGMLGGHKVYVLDNEFNRLALAHLIPRDAPALVKATATMTAAKPSPSEPAQPAAQSPSAAQGSAAPRVPSRRPRRSKTPAE